MATHNTHPPSPSALLPSYIITTIHTHKYTHLPSSPQSPAAKTCSLQTTWPLTTPTHPSSPSALLPSYIITTIHTHKYTHPPFLLPISCGQKHAHFKPCGHSQHNPSSPRTILPPRQGLNQDFETGCPKLAFAKFLVIQGRP